MMSREIANAVTALHGVVPDDPQYIADLIKRIQKALQPLTKSGDIVQVLDSSRRAFWQLRHSR